MPVESTWSVSGMTCEHCDHHVGDAAAELPGVVTAVADHHSGVLTVASEQPLDADALAAVLHEAGYELER